MLRGRRRDLVVGALAGLIGGLLSGWAAYAQAMPPVAAGPLGLAVSPVTTLVNLAVFAALSGAGFGAVIGYQPRAYAATTSSGVLFGLLWWIVGPLTLAPLLHGRGPVWSVGDAGDAFASLVGLLLAGGLTGLCYAALPGLVPSLRPSRAADPVVTPARTRVVILGGGFGGVSTAQALEALIPRCPGLEITLVSQSNYLLFTPMLAEVASSGLEAQHISAPVRAATPYSQFRRAEVEAVDTAARTVLVRGGPSAPPELLDYDHLVLALGSVPSFHNLPGMEEHAFTLKSLQDATTLRNHVIALLEDADLELDPAVRREQLTFVVAGGGFAGTEMIAELFDLVHGVLHYYPRIGTAEPRFVLVHSRDRILPEISAKLADYALRTLRRRGIEFLLGVRVSGASADAILLADGSRVPTRTIVWTAGNQPHPLLRTLPCERNRAGAVVADGTLRISGFENIWAVGDCAEIPDPDHPGQTYPPTAQHALREGKTVAKNIVATVRGQPLAPFRFRTIGMLVALGHHTAAAEVWGWQFSGLLAWLMWRSVYLGKLPGLEKKLRVALDWGIELFFPRDIVLTATGDAPAARPVPSEPPRVAAQERT